MVEAGKEVHGLLVCGLFAAGDTSMEHRYRSMLACCVALAALFVSVPVEVRAEDKPKASDAAEIPAKPEAATAPKEVDAPATQEADKPEAPVAPETVSPVESEKETEAAKPSLQGVAVFVLPKTDASADGAELLQDMLRSQLSSFSGVELRSRAVSARSISRDVARVIEDGFRAVNDNEEEKAIPLFTKALDTLKAHTGALDKRLMARALKGLAVSHALDGDTKKAKTLMNSSLNLWPIQKPLEYAYSIDVFNLYSFVEKSRDSASPASFEVACSAPGAVFFFDGEKQGASPLSLKGLSPGGHWVRVEAEGFQTVSKWVELKAGMGTELEIALVEAADAKMTAELLSKLAVSRKKKSAGEIGEQLSSAIGADRILVIRAKARRKGFDLKGWSVSGAAVTTVKKKVGGNLLTELNDMLMSSLELTPPAGTDDVDTSLGGPRKLSLVKVETANGEQILAPKPSEPEFYETWWFWTATGGAVVTGVILGLVLNTEPEVPRGSLNITVSRVPAQ
jgi:hypothetical protein